MSVDAITAAPQDDCAQLIKLRFGVAKLGRFVDSTRSEGFGEKIEDYGFAAQVGKSYLVAIGGLQPKIRSCVAHLEHFLFTPNFFPRRSLCPPGDHVSSRLRISLTSWGLARPREAFITCPTKDLNTPSLPARYLATFSGFCSTTSRHMRSISPVS